MTTRVRKASLAVAMLALLFVGTGAVPLSRTGTPGHPSAARLKSFKLKGAGQINPSTGGFDFLGRATLLGSYSAAGSADLATGAVQGEFTADDGDTLTWTAQFSAGPLGELEATFTFTGGTGRFEGAGGSASGPVLLDPDFMFLVTLQGAITL